MGTLEEKNLYGKYPKSLCFKPFKIIYVIHMWFNNQVEFQTVEEKTILTLLKMAFSS